VSDFSQVLFNNTFMIISTIRNASNPIGLKAIGTVVTGVESRVTWLCLGISNRHHSSLPSFNPSSTFQYVSQPAPNWKMGDGPSAERTASKRKTWDMSKLGNAR